MIKPIAISILGAVLLACSSPSKENDTKSESIPSANSASSAELLDEYEEYVAEIDSGGASSSTLAMEKYKELFSKSDVEVCDKAFVVFQELYERIPESLNEDIYNDVALQETSWSMVDESGKEQPMPKAFQKVEDQVAKHGYRLEFPEGMISIGLDRSFIAKNFYSFVSPQMKEFLKQLDHDNNLTFSEDAGIIITEKEFVERLVWWENFEKEHPDFILKNRVKAIHQQLFAYFLMGMNNTPAYFMNDEDQSIEIEPYFKTCYDMLQKRYPQSDAWKRTKPYLKALMASDQDGAEAILKDYTKKDWIVDFSKDVEFYL